MDINDEVPLPKKLTTPLPAKPEVDPAPDIDSSVPLPKEFGGKGSPIPLAPFPPAAITRPVEESARLAGGGFDLLKIKLAMDRSETPTWESKPSGVSLPPRLRAHGNREEKVFEPAGSHIPAFVADDNTKIKLNDRKGFSPQLGSFNLVAKCGVEFETPKMGQPMMRHVKIVWPKPMEKALDLAPRAVQPVQSLTKRDEKPAYGSQMYARDERPSAAPKQLEKEAILATQIDILKAEYTSEAAKKLGVLAADNITLREVIKTLGGKVALLEAELQILKAKKG